MTKCRFWEDRYLPIEYSLNDIRSKVGYFSLCLLTKGTAVLEIDCERCYVSSPALLCLNPDRNTVILKSNNLQIKSVFFAPEFINRNLSIERITADDYEVTCKLFDFPSFDLFYKTDDFYNCIIPFEAAESDRVEFLFDSILEQLSVQPDAMWSCRARMAIIRIFDCAAKLHERTFGVSQENDALVDCILTFIEFNIEKQFTIEWLSREYSTNRTTLMAAFKRVTGKTINEFVIDKRIDLSKRILAFTNISIEELAGKCGFSSQSYFTRAFKKKTGLSPMQFRKKAVESRVTEFQEK